MVFHKSFPLTVKGTTYPRWVDITLSDEEEQAIEQQANKENTKVMEECIEEAKQIIKTQNLKDYQTDVIELAIALFEKRASHVIYWKEEKAREKFEKQYQAQNEL